MAYDNRRNPLSGGGRPVHGGAPRAPQAPPPPPKYFGEKGELVESWFNEEAEQVAKSLSGVKTSQLRRFYEDVLQLRRRLDHEVANTPGSTREQAFQRLRPEFKLLRAKAFYANGRSKEVFPDELRVFFDRHVTAVQQYRDFDVFCKHFQAVVAFHKYYEGGRR